MTMIKPIILALSVLSLAGCDLAVLEGKKGSFQIEQERRAALTSDFVAPVAAASPAQAAIEVAAPVQQCFPEFRIRRCGPEGEFLEW